MSVTCPCCGQPVNAGRTPIEALEAAPLSHVRRTIVRTLARAYPRDVSADALLEAVYSGAREPEHPRETLAIQISQMRMILPRYGWTIPPHHGGRGNRATYRLEPFRAD